MNHELKLSLVLIYVVQNPVYFTPDVRLFLPSQADLLVMHCRSSENSKVEIKIQ